MSLYARRKACSDVSLVGMVEMKYTTAFRDDSRLVCSTTLGQGILFNGEKNKNSKIKHALLMLFSAWFILGRSIRF